MASKSKQQEQERSKEEIEEMLDVLSKLLDRTKVMYEQYFMGIQKIAPAQLHKDIERKIRDLTQERIRNTGLRYRMTTMTQKYGSYNTYWRRTMREIEQGRYIRDIARVGRRAVENGTEVPPEILQSMPKRMRDRILRDREMLKNRAVRDHERADGEMPESTVPDAKVRDPRPGNVHRIDMSADSLLDGDLDLDAMFAAITESSDKKPAGGLDVDSMFDAISERSKASAAPVARVEAKVAPRTPSPPLPRAPAPRPTPPRAAEAPRPAVQRPSAAAPPPGMSEAQGRQLYDRYIKAKQLVGEKTDGLSYDKLMRSLGKKAPGIMSKHNASGVDFNVVVKDDRVILKAKPKK